MALQSTLIKQKKQNINNNVFYCANTDGKKQQERSNSGSNMNVTFKNF